MSELHKFLFDGLPVRGMIVRLTDAWTEILARRHTDDAATAWPWPVAELLGEMAAAVSPWSEMRPHAVPSAPAIAALRACAPPAIHGTSALVPRSNHARVPAPAGSPAKPTPPPRALVRTGAGARPMRISRTSAPANSGP